MTDEPDIRVGDLWNIAIDYGSEDVTVFLVFVLQKSVCNEVHVISMFRDNVCVYYDCWPNNLFKSRPELDRVTELVSRMT